MPTLKYVIGNDNNDKGKFVEYFLYDYYQNFGDYDYEPTIIQADENGGQRIGSNKDIVMPDLFISDFANRNLFFVESKGIFNPKENNPSWGIRQSLENEYKNFYRYVFPAQTQEYENFCPTNIVFSIVRYHNSIEGSIKLYFMNINSLGKMKRNVGFDEHKRTINYFTESEVEKEAYIIEGYNFRINGLTGQLYTPFTDDFYAKERYTEIADEMQINQLIGNTIGTF